MAHFVRLMLAALVAVFSLVAFALVPASGWYVVRADLVRSTKDAACDAYIAYRNDIQQPPTTMFVRTRPAGFDNNCVAKQVVKDTGSQVGELLQNYTAVAAFCPANSTSHGGECKCDTGYEERDGQCKTPQSVCVDKATQPAIPPGITQEFNASRPANGDMFTPRKVCIEECQASGRPAYWACGGTRCTVHFTKAEYTGQPCSGDGAGTTPDSDTKPTPPAERCPDGKVPGTFNGTNVCVTPGEAGSSSNTSGTTTNTGTNPDGTPAPSTGSGTGTTSNTSCNGTTCTTTTTTTTTTTNSSGQTSTSQQTSTTQQPQAEHCLKVPKAKECAGNEETQSSFNGACASGFTAKSDDAVINAMAEETFRQNCKVNPDDSETTLAKTERLKTGNQTGDNPNNVSLSVSPSSIDTSDALGGGGGCISDKVLNIAGGTVVLPLSRSCDSFPMLGNLLVAIGFLVAAVIIMRG
uniref:hypothetical protein n=2 Tax=unclassified Variovorax TaxID=663243 RepID=UPI001C646A0D